MIKSLFVPIIVLIFFLKYFILDNYNILGDTIMKNYLFYTDKNYANVISDKYNLESQIELYNDKLSLAKSQIELYKHENMFVQEQWELHINTIGENPVQQYIITKKLLILPYIPSGLKEYYEKVFRKSELLLSDTGMIPLIEEIEYQISYRELLSVLPDNKFKDDIYRSLNYKYELKLKRVNEILLLQIDDENNENIHECIDYETYESNNFIQ